MGEALDFFYTRKEEEDLFQPGKGINQNSHRRKGKSRKKLALQEEKLKESENMEDYRLWGELITAHMYKLTKGMEEAALDNFMNQGKRSMLNWTPPYPRRKMPSIILRNTIRPNPQRY